MPAKTYSSVRAEIQRKFPQYIPHLLTRIEQERLAYRYFPFYAQNEQYGRAIHTLQQANLAEALKAELGDEQYLIYAGDAT